MEEGIRSFLDGPQDGGDVDDGCLAATQALFFAVLGSFLQQRQEGLGRSNLVGHLCLKPAPTYGNCNPGRLRKNSRMSGEPRCCCSGPACSQLDLHNSEGLQKA